MEFKTARRLVAVAFAVLMVSAVSTGSLMAAQGTHTPDPNVAVAQGTHTPDPNVAVAQGTHTPDPNVTLT